MPVSCGGLSRMFESSIIKQTGQWWKVTVAICGCLLAGIAMVVAKLSSGQLTPESFAMTMSLGSALFLGSCCYACLSIRCPSCSKRWLWAAVRTPKAGGWLSWLLAQRACPGCGHRKENDG